MLAGGDIVHNPPGIVGLHLTQDEQRLPGMRTLTSGSWQQAPKHPTRGQVEVGAAAVDGLGERVIQAFRAIAAAAGSHADGDARDRQAPAWSARLRGRR